MHVEIKWKTENYSGTLSYTECDMFSIEEWQIAERVEEALFNEGCDGDQAEDEIQAVSICMTIKGDI